jgi:hypothetical protein
MMICILLLSCIAFCLQFKNLIAHREEYRMVMRDEAWCNSVFEDVIKTLLETERIHSPVPEELSIPSSLRDMNDRERSSSSSRNLSEEEPHLLSRWKTKVALLSPHQLKRNDMNQVDLILHLSRVVIENIVTNEEMEIDTIVLTKRWRLTLSFSRRDGD